MLIAHLFNTAGDTLTSPESNVIWVNFSLDSFAEEIN